MQDGENPAALGAASGSAPSSGQSVRPKIGLNFDPSNIFGSNRDSGGIANVETAALAGQPDEPAINQVNPVTEPAEPELPTEETVSESVEAAEPVTETPAFKEELPSDAELEAEIETENLDTPILDNIPLGEKGPELLNSTRPPAPAKRNVGSAIIIFICVIGILVVGVVLVIVMRLASKAAPAVEGVVETVEEKVEEKTGNRHLELPKKQQPTEEQPAEDVPTEEIPAVQEPVDTSVYINLDTPKVRIKIPDTENYIDYRIIGDKVFFWAATKRDGVDFNATNCESSEQENCESTAANIPAFADRSQNTGGMAFIQYWPSENSDFDTEAFRNGRWVLYYATHRPGELPQQYSTDAAQAEWENESLIFLADFLTNRENFSAIEEQQ